MHSYLNSLPVGGDPRVFNQFIAIREELNKRIHPARPDVNWQYVQELCITLFNQNGVDLQTVAWFVLCRQHQSGLDGLNEGLGLTHRVLIQYWQTLWPEQIHTRINILSVLGQQLISGIRRTTFVYTDLPVLYHTEELLKNINHRLQQLEIKHLTQFEYLENLIITRARQLENADTSDNHLYATDLSPRVTESGNEEEIFQPGSAEPVISASVPLKKHITSSSPGSFSTILQQTLIKKTDHRTLWRGILTGIFTSSLFFMILCYFWLSDLKNHDLMESFPYIPEIHSHISPLIEQQMAKDKHITTTLNDEQMNVLLQRLDKLTLLSPTWAQNYGLEVIRYLDMQYEDNPGVTDFTHRWKNNLKVNATTDEQLHQWSEGMSQLDGLSRRLDSFDENARNYITGSELKSIIFKARQHFNQAKPLEEELRLLEKQAAENETPDYSYQQIDNHFKQLSNRYALFKTKYKEKIH